MVISMKAITKKKMLSLVLGLIMAVGLMGLTGCSGNKVVTLGITQIIDHPSLDVCRQGALDRLAELGYPEGENFVVKYESAQGDPAVASTIAQQFVSDNVNVILAISTPSAQAAYGAAQTAGIPVVFSAVTDPVAAQIADASGAPLPNITGTSDLMPMEASFDLIKALVPDAVKVGILHNTSEVNSDVLLALAQEIAAGRGMEVIDMGITSTNEISAALDALLPQVDVMLNLTDNMVVAAMPLIADKTMAAGVPLFGSEDQQVLNGALASAGIDYYKLGKQTGEMIAKILDGTPAQEIAIETLKDPKLTVNTQVAEQLGIVIPAEILAKAEQVTTTGTQGE